MMAWLRLNIWRSPVLKADTDALCFSAKSFAAAMLAYYISLRIGLPKPYWAIVTVYIVSQGSAGASLSRGVYRLVGTIVGAAATVAIVPNFVNDPIVCSVVLASWIGLCLFFSLLDRTPRAYAFVLAGYTASLIGFPSVLEPGAIFETALVRVQEISMGVLCATLIHRFILPKHVTHHFMGKLAVTLRDASLLVDNVLCGMPEEQTRSGRRQLAADLLTLDGLATHLPYDPAPVTPRRKELRLIHDRLARLLPLTTEIEDRIHALKLADHHVPYELSQLLGEVQTWVTASEETRRKDPPVRLIERAQLLQEGVSASGLADSERVAANLAGHVAEMVSLLYDCDQIKRNIARAKPLRKYAFSQEFKRAKGYVYHRDSWMAARAALGAITGILIGCAFWIWSGWPEGGLAVSILGVCCALFGNADAPAPNVARYMVGSVYGVVISLAYSFLIFPRVTDFAELVIVLAPSFLLAGSLQARPPMTFKALGITLTIPILSGLGSSYAANFADSLNTVVALFAAIGFGLISMSLFQTVPVTTLIHRLLRLSRRDIKQRALGIAREDEAHWTNLMVDRTALLLPRLRLSEKSCLTPFDDTLHHLRIGHAVGQIRKISGQVDSEMKHEIRAVLLIIATYFAGAKTPKSDLLISLTDRIQCLLAKVVDSSIDERSVLLNLLIDLWFALRLQGSMEGQVDL